MQMASWPAGWLAGRLAGCLSCGCPPILSLGANGKESLTPRLRTFKLIKLSNFSSFQTFQAFKLFKLSIFWNFQTFKLFKLSNFQTLPVSTFQTFKFSSFPYIGGWGWKRSGAETPTGNPSPAPSTRTARIARTTRQINGAKSFGG